jgi:hypothetical protein
MQKSQTPPAQVALARSSYPMSPKETKCAGANDEVVSKLFALEVKSKSPRHRIGPSLAKIPETPACIKAPPSDLANLTHRSPASCNHKFYCWLGIVSS